jgi:hypothetical protein
MGQRMIEPAPLPRQRGLVKAAFVNEEFDQIQAVTGLERGVHGHLQLVRCGLKLRPPLAVSC